jgi:hypothetical protein
MAKFIFARRGVGCRWFISCDFEVMPVFITEYKTLTLLEN